MLADRRFGFWPLLAGDLRAFWFGRKEAQARAIDNEANRHPDSGAGEAPMPAVELAQGPAHQRREEAAEIDAHVIGAVRVRFARIVVAVEASDLHRERRNEEAVAERHKRQGRK